MILSATSWFDFVILQMAAESYLPGVPVTIEQFRRVLKFGNNNPQFNNDANAEDLLGKTRFTDKQIEYFDERWDIVHHRPDDDPRTSNVGVGNGTGFSATLFRNRSTGEYTLSFRSTEYADEDKGGDWLRDGMLGADGEIVKKGFAFGQILAMEDYYDWLTSGPDPLLPANAMLNVTGYSLGGHLATIFTELHADRINHTYTFNSAGRGRFDSSHGDLSDILDFFRAQLGDSVSQTNVYNDARYLAAVEATRQAFDTRGVSLPQGSTGLDLLADGKISQLFGHAMHGDSEWVANSGVHAAYPVPIFIEDQPDVQGVVFDFLERIFKVKSGYGGTHSITLIADSLAVMDLLQQIDANISTGQMGAILAAGSHQRAVGFIGTQGIAEGNSLENVVRVNGVRVEFPIPAIES